MFDSYNNTIPDMVTVSCGVPHGSVLGPLLMHIEFFSKYSHMLEVLKLLARNWFCLSKRTCNFSKWVVFLEDYSWYRSPHHPSLVQIKNFYEVQLPKLLPGAHSC